MEFNMEPEKKVTLDNGLELTYYEVGEQNEEVLIIGQWYYNTFMDWLRALGKDLHVYALVLRGAGQGPEDQFAADGSVHWEKQWAEDIYRFAQKMGIEKFVYGGKCHGSYPCWYLAKEHKDVLKAIIASSWIPNKAPVMGQKAMAWKQGLATNRDATIATSMRYEENLKLKLAEMETISVVQYVTLPNEFPLSDCKNQEEINEYLKGIELPVLVTAGYDDPLMDIPTLVEISRNIPKAKVVLYPNERHFYEMDTPEKLASEWTGFISQVNAGDFLA